MRFIAAATVFCALLARSKCAAESKDTTPSLPRRVLPSNFKPPQVFQNINLLRNTNLEKGYVRETVNVVIANVDRKAQSEYYLAFPTSLYRKVGGLEVHDKNDPEKKRFEIEATEFVASSSLQFLIAHFPEPLAPSSQLTLSISYYVLGVLEPLPAAIEQDDKQYLTYTFSAYVPSAYSTVNQKTKLKFPNTDIRDYTTTSGLKSGADPEKHGSSYTYGPYKTSKVPPGTVEPVTVRYEFTKPIIACSLLERDIEVSHWGGNLATEERYWLRNDGAKLSKPFSRVTWTAKMYQHLPSVAASELKIPLKPGSIDPYFTDDIGNVSTSRYRPGLANREASLELKPRYPIFGGWKYSFRIGWNNALSSFLRKAASGGGDSYILKVPFLEGPKIPEGVQYEKVELQVILPEGARDVQFETVGGTGMPMSLKSELTLRKTFMDTSGRTVLKLTAANLADEARDGQLIVKYTYPFLSALRKPVTIFAGVLSVFATVWVIGQIDVSIKKR